MADVPPPVGNQMHPEFWRLNEYEFQNLAADLFSREPDVESIRVHGARGQKQLGVDAAGFIRGGGRLAVSCKRYKSDVDVQLVRKACAEFDEHWKYWKAEGVKRFVVMVAEYAESPDVQKEEAAQRARYKRKKVEFELWDGTILLQKIRKHPGLVNQYLRSETWTSLLCSEYRPTTIGQSGIREAESQHLAGLLEEYARKDIDALRGALRRGHRTEVLNKLTALRNKRGDWEALSPKVRASALRLQAALDIEAGSLQLAEVHLNDAVRLDPSSKAVGLLTRIRLQRDGPEKALAELDLGDEDVEALCARGSLLLLLSRPDEAAPVLEAAHKKAQADVDAVRLLALLSAMRGDIPRSLQFVELGSRLAPEWETVRWTQAVVYYLSALSTPDAQRPISAMPEPVEWAFVRRDRLSIERFAESFEIFRQIANNPDLPQKDREGLEIWALACISNIESRSAEASEYCGHLISKHPCNVYAVPWAMARGYRVNFDRAASISEQVTDKNLRDLRPVLIGVMCKIRVGDFDGAKALLRRFEDAFRDARQINAWNHSWALVLLLSGDSAAVLDFVSSSQHPADLEPLQLAASVQAARRSGDTAEAKRNILCVYERTRDSRYLLLWAEQEGTDENWAAVAEKSDLLLESFPTPDGLYLVLTAGFRTGKYSECLSRTEKYRDVFPASQWPLEVRRLRIGCLERTGKLSEAFKEALQLRREDDSVETGVSFVRLCVGVGDIPDAIAEASTLADRVGLSADDAISLSVLLSSYDPQLARRLLRLARLSALPEHRLLDALRLGQKLATAAEQGELRERLEGAVAQGSDTIRVLQADEIRLLYEQTMQRAGELVGLYESGQIPIHALLDSGLNLLPLTDGAVEDFRPLDQFARFTNHGSGRDGTSNITAGVSHLNLDITSALLIQQLSLWEPLEQVFPQVRCSRLIIPLMNQVLGAMMSSQPQEDAAFLEISRALASGRLAVTAEETDWVVSESEQGRNRIGGRFLVDVLRQRGEVSEEEHARGALLLPRHTGECSEVAPERSASILWEVDSLVSITIAGLLTHFTTFFSCRVSTDALELVEGRVRTVNEKHDLAKAAKAAIEGLGQRIRTGMLTTFPEAPSDEAVQTLAMSALSELMNFPESSRDLICADDRYINGFEYRETGGVPIICLRDVLKVLVARGVLAKTQLWQIRHFLRTHNCRYMPLEAEEISYHVLAAKYQNGVLVETPELRAMRQYLGACLARGRVLQRPNPLTNQKGEVAFILDLRRSMVEALTLIWRNELLSAEDRRARASWVIRSLYIDFSGLCVAAGIEMTQSQDRQLTAMAAATLMLLNIGSGNSEKGEVGVYNAWIWNSLFRRRASADPELHEGVSTLIAQYLEGMIEKTKPEERPRLVRGTLAIVARFPESLRQRVHERLASIYSQTEGVHRMFSAGGYEFDATEFMEQVSVALVSGSAEVRSLRPEALITIRASVGTPSAVDLVLPNGNIHRLMNALWCVLLPDQFERQGRLQAIRSILDLNDREFESMLDVIGSAPTPFARFEAAAKTAQGSLPFFFDALQRRLNNREELTSADVVPSDGSAFYRYFGHVGESNTASELICNGLDELLKRVGAIEAAVRFSALPIGLPARIEMLFKDSTSDQQHEYIRAIAKAGFSPTRRIHLLRLTALAHPTPFTRRLSAFLLRGYFGESTDLERKAFIAIFKLVAGVFASSNGRWTRSVRLMFVWVNATLIFAIYRRSNISSGWIEEAFSRVNVDQSIVDMEDEFVNGRDVSSPDAVHPELFSLCGLEYALTPDRTPLADGIAAAAKSEWFSDGGPPRALFLGMPSVAPNLLGAFFGGDHLESIQRLLGKDASEFTPTWRNQFLERTLASISEEGELSEGWPFIAAFYGTSPAPSEVAERIDDALARVNLPNLVEAGGTVGRVSMFALANRIVHSQKEQTRKAISDSIQLLASWYGKRDGAEEDANNLLNLALAYGYPARGSAATIDNLQEICIACSQEFPLFVRRCRSVIEGFCDDLPTEEGKKFWPLALALRAMDKSK